MAYEDINLMRPLDEDFVREMEGDQGYPQAFDPQAEYEAAHAALQSATGPIPPVGFDEEMGATAPQEPAEPAVDPFIESMEGRAGDYGYGGLSDLSVRGRRANRRSVPKETQFGEDVGAQAQPSSLGVDLGLEPRLGDYREPVTEYGDMVAEPSELAEKPDYEDMSGMAWEREKFEQEQRRADYQRQLQQDADARFIEQQEANRKTYEDAIKASEDRSRKMLDEAEALGKVKVDPDRWFKNGGTARKVTTLGLALLGGQIQLDRGGGHQGWDFIEGEIKADVDAQVRDIENRHKSLDEQRGLVADLYRKTGDLKLSRDTALLAMGEQLKQEMDSKMAAFDPQGTQRLQWEQRRREIDARQAASAEAARQQYRKEAIEDAKLANELRETDIKMAAEGRQQGKQAWDEFTDEMDYHKKGFRMVRDDHGNVVGFKRAAGRGRKPLTPDQQMKLTEAGYMPFLDKHGQIVKDPNWQPGQDMESQKKLADLDKSLAEAEKAQREVSADDTAVRDPRTGEKMLLNGKPWRTAKAEDISTRMAQTQIGRRVVDKIKEGIHKYGGASKWLESDEYQEFQALVKKLDMDNAVNLGLGAISKDDLVQLRGYRGGVDPDSYFLNASRGLEVMATGMEEDVNTRMKAAGWTGDVWKPIRSDLAEATERSTPDIKRSIAGKRLPHQTADAHFKAVQANTDVFLSRKPTSGEITSLMREVALDSSLSKDQREQIAAKVYGAWSTGKRTPGDWYKAGEDNPFKGKSIVDPGAAYLEILGGGD